MNTISKTVVEIPIEEWNEQRATSRKILQALEGMKIIAPPDFLSRKEFMARCRIASTKMHYLLRSGKLKYRKVGRMVYIPADQVDRFFQGELE